MENQFFGNLSLGEALIQSLEEAVEFEAGNLSKGRCEMKEMRDSTLVTPLEITIHMNENTLDYYRKGALAHGISEHDFISLFLAKSASTDMNLYETNEYEKG